MQVEPSTGEEPERGKDGQQSGDDPDENDEPQYAPPPDITEPVVGPGDDETLREWLMKQRVRDLRVYIACQAGQRTTPRTPLDIETLNSVHAYLGGSFFVEPRLVGTPLSPGHGPIREAVVREVLGWEKENRKGIVVGTMANYFPDPEETDGSWEPTPFRLDHLRALAHCLDDTDDQRGWV